MKLGTETIIALLVVAIIVSVVFTYLNVSRITKITGYGTAGYVNVTVSTSVIINVTAVNCDFGSGYISPPSSTALLESNGTVINWTGAGTNVNLTIRNDGNVNVTLNVSSGKTELDFYGAGTNTSITEYKFWTADKEPGACKNATGNGPGNVPHPGIEMDATNKTACPWFQFYDDKDEIYVMCRLVIHETVPPGSKTDTWTFYAFQI